MKLAATIFRLVILGRLKPLYGIRALGGNGREGSCSRYRAQYVAPTVSDVLSLNKLTDLDSRAAQLFLSQDRFDISHNMTKKYFTVVNN